MKYQWKWNAVLSDEVIETEDYYTPGETCNMSHVYKNAGLKVVKVRAIDEFGEPSPWSDPFYITVKLNIKILTPIDDIEINGIPGYDMNFTGNVMGGQQTIAYNWSFGGETTTTAKQQNTNTHKTEPTPPGSTSPTRKYEYFRQQINHCHRHTNLC